MRKFGVYPKMCEHDVIVLLRVTRVDNSCFCIYRECGEHLHLTDVDFEDKYHYQQYSTNRNVFERREKTKSIWSVS